MPPIELLFATHNAHKLREVSAIIGTQFRLLTLGDVGFDEEIPEPHATLHENALEKAQVLHRLFPQFNVIAEDTGLEVAALNGAPGVMTARYAGTGLAQDNMHLLLQNLQSSTNRAAQFRTVLALIERKGQTHYFEGIAQGTIRTEPSGTGGFGYDPIFEPKGYHQTFAEMPDILKNSISHRYKALQQLSDFLQQYSAR